MSSSSDGSTLTAGSLGVPFGSSSPSTGTGSNPMQGEGPLRIAFFTDTFEPTNDGVAKVSSTLASALSRRGHQVTVFTVRAPGLPRIEVRSDGVRIRRFLSVAAPSYPQYRIAFTPWHIPLSPSRFDIVHIHTPGFMGLAGWFAARRWGIPSVGTYHTNLTNLLRNVGRTGPTRAFFRAWSKFSIDLCRHCSVATAPSDAALSDILERAPSVPRKGPRLVPNGVDTERFRPGIRDPDWRRRLGIGDVPIVLFLGRLTRDKGVGRFLAAVERVDRGRPWLALVAGEGPLGHPLEQRLRPGSESFDRARFIGPVLEEEKPALLAQSQAFVMPSLSDTSSVALLEAMASGVPSVVSAFGGPAEIARRSSVGLVVDPRDADRLAGAIAQLLGNPPLARSFAMRGRDWVREHASAERMAREFVDCYRSVGRTPTLSS